MNVKEYIKDLLEHPEKYHHKVIWYVNVLRFENRKYSLGYCTYGKGIAFINDDPLTPLIVNDVVIQPALDDGTSATCSDAKWCFNANCPLCDIEGKRRLTLKENVEEIEKRLEELGLSFEKANCERILFEKPVIELRRCK
ncbi:hypothetical protein [Sulfolobus spindle-shaped virus]|nr:hypothetical protein [Sulfolobus spindle-shaped virus]AZG03624.1 hypothetical protein [Sulfolobus spindle-shaped virus]AZG03667.1 hypothetical protein [Sulfolobus spindle-shaped virus]AZG03763.1 hypothetical protein [Sulfolobus spindle-shaped virus]AZG03804.1 hypothetical protein [Sulfolobus spindle-shaped virus]